MAKIYLSSTYGDLKDYREAVYHTLRQMRHDVIAMEDYVATDRRPLQKCLTDVAECDLYIGLFAWRYGYIPQEENPENKSITELEYRQAIKTGKSCLIFILAEDVPWPRTQMEVVTGEGNRGELIDTLRRELKLEKTVNFFKTPEHLASLVGPAVHLWESCQIMNDSSSPSAVAHSKDADKSERETRLRATLADHSSFMRDRLNSFVGREQELAEIRQRIAEKQSTGGYVTITGQAGQGKSSIIAKLVDSFQQEYGPEKIAFHFIPFNPGSDHQVGLLRNLMARLILKYNLSDLYVLSESRPALRDYFPKVLAEVAAKGGQEVIFIDGLDQLEEDATSIRDLSFLPNNPPPGVVFVLGTRPNDTLRPLELLKPRYEYQLPNLSREDFNRILQHRQVRLDKGLADQFYNVMKGNALYLDLLAKELTERGTTTPEELIKQIADNPEHLFSLTMIRLKRQPIEWREVIKPILGVLLVAQEPLGVRHIRHILGVDDERLRAALERLGGLTVRDWQQHYSLFHLKLYEYLLQNEQRPAKEYIFATDEEEGWHSKLAKWCEQGYLPIIWQDEKHDPIEQQRRKYARKHYITHLYHAHEWQRLFEVLDTMQYGQAKIRIDPSTRSYAQDVDLGRQAATWKEWTVEAGISLLPRLWQYTLLRSSLTSRADQYPLAAFQLLVLLKRKQEALDLAELLKKPADKVRVLLRIAEQLRVQADLEADWLEVLIRAGEIAQTIEKSNAREEVLRGLAVALAQAQQWEHAQAVILTIKDNNARAGALRDLGVTLAQAQQWEHAQAAWSEAEAAIHTIGNNNARDRALRGLAVALAQAQQWEHAQAVILTVKDNNARAGVLRDLAVALAQAQQWERAEAVILTIENGYARVGALWNLAVALAQAQQWERAEAIILMIEYRRVRTKALRDFAVALAQAQQWERAQAVILTIKDNNIRAGALRDLAVTLAQAQLWERAEAIWIEAEATIGTTEKSLAMALTQAQQWEHSEATWTEAEATIRAIENLKLRARGLRELAAKMALVGEYEQLLHLIQRSWWLTRTREDAFQLFHMATGFIPQHPELGSAFYEAFTWVDTFFTGEGMQAQVLAT